MNLAINERAKLSRGKARYKLKIKRFANLAIAVRNIVMYK